MNKKETITNNLDSTALAGVKCCLVFPRYQESQDLIFLKTVKKHLGKIPPLSLCAVAAVLEKNGAKVKIIDANASDLSLAETKNRFNSEKTSNPGEMKNT